MNKSISRTLPDATGIHPQKNGAKHNLPHKRSKSALVLAGGGVTGVVYEVGALRAMDDLLVDMTVNDFDIYVGTSAGALVSAFIANGFAPGQVMQLINERHPELHGIHLRDILGANIEEAVGRLADAPRTLWSICSNLLRNPQYISPSDLMWEAARLLPAGLYDGMALERYVRSTIERHSLTNSFGKLQKELYIVASELDSGARAVFGKGSTDEVPISLAVAASSAVPALYRPVQIHEKDYLDGMLHGAASLDLAIEAGAKLIVCVNPMVPFNASEVRPHEHYIRRNGLQAVVNQSLRTLLHATLRYHIKNLRIKHPDVDIILIQPALDDHVIFSHGPMDYAGRLEVAAHGFESVSRGLLQNSDHYNTILSRHGVAMHTDLVRDEVEKLSSAESDAHYTQELIEAGQGARSGIGNAISQLERSLKRLNRSLDRVPVSA